MNKRDASLLLEEPRIKGTLEWDYVNMRPAWDFDKLDIAGRYFTADQLRALLWFYDNPETGNG